MGMSKCPLHGLSPGITCCTHVADAVDVNQALPAHVVLDDWITPTIVCKPCEELVNTAEIDRSPDREPRVGFSHVLASPPVAYCYPCVAEWYAKTRQGDLSESIDTLVAPYLKKMGRS